MNLSESGQRVLLGGGKRGIAYRAGLYMNYNSSLDARNRDTAVSGPVRPMAVDRKPTTSKSPGIRSRAGGLAESAGARAIQGRGLRSQKRVIKKGTGTRRSRKDRVYEGSLQG